jgi:hypothetical protein
MPREGMFENLGEAASGVRLSRKSAQIPHLVKAKDIYLAVCLRRGVHIWWAVAPQLPNSAVLAWWTSDLTVALLLLSFCHDVKRCTKSRTTRQAN